MEFGLQFFPDVSSAQKSAAEYFSGPLKLVELCDDYGDSSTRTARTRKARPIVQLNRETFETLRRTGLLREETAQA